MTGQKSRAAATAEEEFCSGVRDLELGAAGVRHQLSRLHHGGELRHPVEITDPDLLGRLDPWTGSFVDWEQPPQMGHCSWEYDIQYFNLGIEHPTPYDRGDQTMIYGVRYCLGDDGAPGYVQLAGPTERFGPENVRSVWDGTHAGKWHLSTPAWKEFVEHVVASQRRSAR